VTTFLQKIFLVLGFRVQGLGVVFKVFCSWFWGFGKNGHFLEINRYRRQPLGHLPVHPGADDSDKRCTSWHRQPSKLPDSAASRAPAQRCSASRAPVPCRGALARGSTWARPLVFSPSACVAHALTAGGGCGSMPAVCSGRSGWRLSAPPSASPCGSGLGQALALGGRRWAVVIGLCSGHMDLEEGRARAGAQR
jgi:hypothetical protein